MLYMMSQYQERKIGNTMRVIEYGHIKPKQLKCNNCGCIFEYVPKDLKTYSKGYVEFHHSVITLVR